MSGREPVDPLATVLAVAIAFNEERSIGQVLARLREVYPTYGTMYTKMRPVTDWWSILRPIVMLGLRLRA